MSNPESEEVRLLKEILKWIRFTAIGDVKSVLITSLDTDQKRIVYAMSDGEKSSSEVSKYAGVSDWTVRDYWKKWGRIGIVESIKVGGGERGRRSFDPEDFGIEIPSIQNLKSPKNVDPGTNVTAKEM